jgi:hypothetical protein
VGGGLISLVLVTLYPDDHKAMVEQMVRENGTGFLPPLKTRIDNIEKYDILFVGSPTWECNYRH